MKNLHEIYQHLEQMINQKTKETPQTFTSGKFTGQGWIFNSSDLPKITLKAYDQSVHLYLIFWTFDPESKDKLLSAFPKSSVGKSCLRIKSLTKERDEAIQGLIDLALK